jgi:drug/metabolite transporter (DMT)-like permease
VARGVSAGKPVAHPSADTAWTGPLLIAVSAVCFAGTAILARLAYADGVDPRTFLALRFAVAGLALVPLAAARRAQVPRGGVLVGLVLMGAVGYAGQATAYFTALTLAPAGLVALLLYTYPALVVLLAAALFGERLRPLRLSAIVLALVGTALAVGAGGGGDARGAVLALVAAAIYAAYILAGSRFGRGVPALTSSAVVVPSAAIAYAVVLALGGATWPASAAGWAAVVGVGLLSAAAISLFLAGLARTGPGDAAALSTVEPIATVLLAAAVLAEPLGAAQVAGGALILAAVVVLARTGVAP